MSTSSSSRPRRRNPTHRSYHHSIDSTQQLRLHPLLSNTGSLACKKELPIQTNVSDHAPPSLDLETTSSTLLTPSTQRLTRRTRASWTSSATKLTDITMFSRLSEASRDNRILREENEKLMAQLQSVRANQGRRTVRSQSSASLSTRDKKCWLKQGSMIEKPLAKVLEKIRRKIFKKWAGLKDAFLEMDREKCGSVNMHELGTALTKVGLVNAEDLAQGRLQSLFNLCSPIVDVDGSFIRYNDFAIKIQRLAKDANPDIASALE